VVESGSSLNLGMHLSHSNQVIRRGAPCGPAPRPAIGATIAGTVGISAVGMFGAGQCGWRIAPTMHPLDLIVGSAAPNITPDQPISPVSDAPRKTTPACPADTQPRWRRRVSAAYQLSAITAINRSICTSTRIPCCFLKMYM
jgi:hypothetical protein